MKTRTTSIEYEYAKTGDFIPPEAVTISFGDSRIRYVPETVEVVVVEPTKPTFAIGDIVEVVPTYSMRGWHGVVVKSEKNIVVEFGKPLYEGKSSTTRFAFSRSHALRLVTAATP